MELNNFDLESLCMDILLSKDKKVSLCFSDELEFISNLPRLPLDYEKRIIEFLEKHDIWYKYVVDRMEKEFNSKAIYELTNIYILSEPQAKNLVFGLGFWVSEDIEHGRGIKIEVLDDGFKILEYGLFEIISYPYGLY